MSSYYFQEIRELRFNPTYSLKQYEVIEAGTDFSTMPLEIYDFEILF